MLLAGVTLDNSPSRLHLAEAENSLDVVGRTEGILQICRYVFARISNLIQTSRPSGGLERLYS